MSPTPRLPLRACCLVLLGSIATGQSPKDASAGERLPKDRALKAVRRAFHPTGDATIADRRAALDQLEGFDDKAVAQTLIQVYQLLDREITELEEARLAMNRELHQTVEIDDETKRRGGARGRAVARRELRVQSVENRDAVDPLRLLRRRLRSDIASLQSAEAVKVLFARAANKGSAPLLLRIAAIRAIAGSEEALGSLIKLLRKGRRDDETLAIALVGCEVAFHAGQDPHLPMMASMQFGLSHPEVAIRELAARALAASEAPDAVPWLIQLLGASKGTLAERVGKLLEGMTGESLGDVAPSWQAWWTDHEARYRSGALRLARPPARDPRLGTGEVRKPARPARKRRKQKRGTNEKKPLRPQGTTYMGIPQNGSSIVYAIDASLSMRVAVDFKVPGLTIAGGGKATRFDACKAELQRALGGLRPDQSFNIIHFHETAGRFRPAPVPATPENVSAARQYVRGLKLLFATNIHDGLFEAYTDLADDLASRPLGGGIDTVFLLTDGQPANLVPPQGPGGRRSTRRDPPPKLLAMIDDADPFDRVTLHCIGIGKGLNQNLLRALAAARGGVAKFY